MIPDLGTLRDRAKTPVGQYFFGLLALGWRGSVRHWMRYETASLLLAGLATPLVLSVHTVISFDFAVAIIPGWHTTIFPPYFVAGAIYAGFAMVLTLAIPIRKIYGLEDFITMRHLENMGKVTLVTGMIVGYGYTSEAFFGWYSANKYEGFMIWNRMTGPYWYMYWTLIFCNIITPQWLWIRKVRTTPILLFAVAMVLVAAALSSVVAETTARQVQRELLSSGAVYDRLWQQRARTLGGAGQMLARDFGFREAVATGDEATMRSALEGIWSGVLPAPNTTSGKPCRSERWWSTRAKPRSSNGAWRRN